MPDQDGGHSRSIHAFANRLASACETPDMRNLRNLLFATPSPRTAIFPGDGECCANQSCPAASVLNREVFLDINFNTDPLPQTQDVSARLLELCLDERRLWVVGNRLLAVVVDVDGTYQVSLLVACAIAKSRPDAPVVAETDALGARDLFRKGEIENRHWPLYRRLGGGARHCRKEGDQNGAHNASYCWHLPVLLNEISCDGLAGTRVILATLDMPPANTAHAAPRSRSTSSAMRWPSIAPESRNRARPAAECRESLPPCSR